MNWLHSHITAPGNYIFMGDFNTQSSNESCFQQLIASANPNTLFFDPVNQPGDWNNNANNFAGYLTQSTRTSDPGDCGATGGMDDRFDHILCTRYLMDGLDSLEYIPGSYDIIGQDGQHVNKSIVANPTNSFVPAYILNALYRMSEHLPVMLQLAVGARQTTGILSESSAAEDSWTYSKLVTNELHIRYTGNEQVHGSVRIYNTAGQLLHQENINTASGNLKIDLLPAGMYVIQISTDDKPAMNGRFIKLSQ
jgi:hypothetical protein